MTFLELRKEGVFKPKFKYLALQIQELGKRNFAVYVTLPGLCFLEQCSLGILYSELDSH